MIDKQDILTLEENELKVLATGLSHALNIAGVGVWDWNMESNITVWNEKMFEIYGLERMVPMPYENWMNRILPEDRTNVEASIQQAVSHKTKASIHFRIINSDNNIRYIESSADVVCDDWGKVIRVIGTNIDITEKKVLEQELEKSDKVLHELTKNVPGTIYQYRLYPDGRATFPYTSNSIKDLYELSPDDLLNDATPAFKRIHQDDLEMMVSTIENSAETMKDWNIEYRVKLPKKGVRWIEGRSKPEKLEDGSVLWHGYLNDITEQKNLELELINSQEQLSLNNQINKTIMDTIPVRIFWQDKDNMYLGANKVFLDDANLNKEEEIIGKSDFELPWKRLAKKYIDDDLEVINSGKAKLNIQGTLKKGDGEVMNIQISKSPLRDKDDNIIGIVCTFVDITQKIMTEKNLKITNDSLEQKKYQLETIIQEAPNPMIIHNENGEILMINKVWEKLTGYSYCEINTVDKWTKKAYGKRMSEVKEHIDKLYNTNEKIDSGQFDINTKDGKIITWQFYTASLGLIDGKRTIMTSAMDITELKYKDAILISQSRYAAMGEMIEMIAHQWRQPLNALALIIQKISKYKDTGNLTNQILTKSINKSLVLIYGMSDTVDDFRNFFSPEKERETFSLSTEIDKACSLIDPILREYSIECELNLDENVFVQGYRNEFLQVLLNLLANAREALLRNNIKNPKIIITVKEIENFSLLWVEDNAGGVPENIINNIFNPYFSTKEKSSGTGLGLHMSKTIIEDHMKGRLNVRNTNNGVCFEIMIEK